MKTKIQNAKNKVILAGVLLLLNGSALMAQSGGTAILNKTTALTTLIINILNIVLPMVAAGSFIWLCIGIFTKAQDIKQRAVYFVIGAVLMGLQSTIISSLQTL